MGKLKWVFIGVGIVILISYILYARSVAFDPSGKYTEEFSKHYLKLKCDDGSQATIPFSPALTFTLNNKGIVEYGDIEDSTSIENYAVGSLSCTHTGCYGTIKFIESYMDTGKLTVTVQIIIENGKHT